MRSPEQKAKRRTPEERAKANAYARKWRSRPENYNAHLSRCRSYHDANKGKINYQKSKKYSEDIEYREKKRFGNIRWLYGITADEYQILIEQQNGCCAICESTGEDRQRKRLSVDHDHATGRIRGLLCSKCNAAIGMLDEDLSRIRRLMSYLEKTDA